METLKRLLSWPLRKLAFAAFLAALGLTGAALWIFLHDEGSFQASQRHVIEKLTADNVRLKAARDDADLRMAATRTEIAARQLRADQAAKIARNLDDLNGGLDRVIASSEQVKENEERIIRMKQMEIDSRKRAADLDQNLIRIQWEKDGMEIALERNQKQLATTTVEDSTILYYARRAWESYGKAVLAVVVVIMFAPVIWRAWRFSRS